MLTPTGVTSAAYWEAIKSGMPTHVRITFLGQEIVLTDEDIDISGGLQVTDILNGDTDLVFGKAICKQVSVTFLNSERLDGLLWTSEFKLEMGVEIGNNTTWVTLGYFTGEKPKNVTTVRSIEFVAYDRMTRFDILADNFVTNITYPATVSDIYNGLCNFVGVDNVAGNELENIMSRSYADAPVDMIGYTCRDILAWIAEAAGCYAKIDNNGKCKLVWFADNTEYVVTADEEFSVETADAKAGLTWDEADTFTWDEIESMTWNDICGYEEAFSIDQILVKQLGNELDVNYPYAYGGNVYMLIENPFLSVSSKTDINNFIKPIYDRLTTFGGYLPVNLQCVGNWCVEAGDVITIFVNENNISFPIFCKTMTWNSAVNDEYETTGNNNRSVYASEKNKQKVIENNKIEMYVGELEEEVENNFYRVRSGITISASGVEITGGRFISIEAGSRFDNSGDINILTGGTVNVESGGKTIVKSGASIDVESGGDINVKSGANVNVKNGGDVEVESGGNVNIKSGGALNIASGGSIDIHASGTLELTGSAVSIKSNSSFDLDSNNFKINSTGQYIRVPVDADDTWIFDNKGLRLYNSTQNHNVIHLAGEFTGGSTQVPDAGLFAYILNGDTTHGRTAWTGIDRTANRYSFLYFEYDATTGARLLPNIDYGARIGAVGHSFAGIYTNRIYGSATSKEMYIYPSADDNRLIRVADDTSDGKYKLQGYTVSGSTWTQYEIKLYGSVSAISSRYKKHNIEKLADVGSVIDKLEPVSFAYNNDPKNRKRLGLIYEDTVGVLPEICEPGDERTDKAINYVELVPVLLKEIQSLRKRVKELEEVKA